MDVESGRYRIHIEEITKGGPGGYESTYLVSEGEPAAEELYTIMAGLEGTLLPAQNRIIRQRNNYLLTDALKERRPVGIASGFKPSGAFHFGHRLTSSAASFFQKNGVQIFMPVADIECAMDPKLSDDQYQYWAADNLLDWGASGVNLDAAHVYLQSEEFRVSTLAYVVARSLNFRLAVDIYGAKKLIDDFPFLFAGVTQVGDILLPQHQDFGNDHSFMLSGQDQDGHMKMTIALVESMLDSKTNALSTPLTVPSGFYIPHIRGTDGQKMSSSNPEHAFFLGSGPAVQDLTDRIRSTTKKLDEADKDNLERCSLDVMRYIDFFNLRGKVSFQGLSSELIYQELQQNLDLAKTKEEQEKVQFELDDFLIRHCKNQRQDNVSIVRDSLPEALTEHHRRREAVLNYAKERVSNRPAGAWDLDYYRPVQPEFWQVPDGAIVDESKRNTTQWFHIINRASHQIIS